MQPKIKHLQRCKYDCTGGPATFEADVLKMIANDQVRMPMKAGGLQAIQRQRPTVFQTTDSKHCRDY